MPTIDLPFGRDALDLITVAGAAAAVLGLLLALVANWRIGRLRRRVGRTAKRQHGADTASAGGGPVAVSADGQSALRRVAVVRFDAFPGVNGQLSFAAALLDDSGHGLVLTSIHGRNEARTYAKALNGGVSSQALSPEEEQAIEQALVGDAGHRNGDGMPAGVDVRINRAARR